MLNTPLLEYSAHSPHYIQPVVIPVALQPQQHNSRPVVTGVDYKERIFNSKYNPARQEQLSFENNSTLALCQHGIDVSNLQNILTKMNSALKSANSSPLGSNLKMVLIVIFVLLFILTVGLILFIVFPFLMFYKIYKKNSSEDSKIPNCKEKLERLVFEANQQLNQRGMEMILNTSVVYVNTEPVLSAEVTIYKN